MNRAGDKSAVAAYRVDRFFAVNDSWYFSTRENEDQGPYPSKPDAEKALVSYMRAYKELGGQDSAHSGLVRKLELGFDELVDLNVIAAWEILYAAAEEMGVVVEGDLSNKYTFCDQVLRTAEYLHKREDEKFADLPRHLKEYSRRSAALPFPLAGMLVPERLYVKPSGGEDYFCKVSETGNLVVADTAGNRTEESLSGLPLDTRSALTVLIARMQGIVSV